jgi:hypothetical protein
MTSTLIAYDGSGSTDKHAFYHDQTQRIVAALPPDSKILFWDTASRIVNHWELAAINKARKGGGGTEPGTIASYIASTGFNGDLVIITDGQVGSVSHVDSLLPPSATFKGVTAHLIHTGGTVNMSVTCPFTRRSPHQIYLYGEDKEQRLVTSTTAEDLAVVNRIASINTITEFEVIFPTLEKAVVAATMGSNGDPTLRDALLAMKSRIMKVEARMKGDSATVKDLNAALDERRMTEALALAHALTEEYYGDETEDPDATTWSARISRLVSMTEGALRGTFDLSGISAAIRGDRARRATTAAPAPASAVSPMEAAPGQPTFECPITCYDEADVVILVTEGPPILAGLDKDIVNSLYDCPLNLLNHPSLIDAIKERIDHPISLRAFQDAHTAGLPFTSSPLTRRPLQPGGICLGLSEAHCRATTWTLSNLYTGGKLIGNQDFWFACIWLLVERGHLAYLGKLLPQLRTHMLWRILNHSSAVGLSGLPELPTTRVPLRTALWYVFASAEFGMRPDRDLIRAHLPHLDALQELLTLTGLELSPAVTQHVTRVRVLMSMLSWVKRDRHMLPVLMRALTQCCVEIDVPNLRMKFESMPQFIPIDGAPTEEQRNRVLGIVPELYRRLSIEELVGLAALVNPSKSASDIALPISWTPPPLPASTMDGWPHHTACKVAPSPVKLCPTTCRPYYYVGDKTWAEAAQDYYGLPYTKHSQFLSMNEAYGNFVLKYDIYPTSDELLMYLHNRYSDRKSLPYDLVLCVDEAIATAQLLTETLSASEFARRFNESREIETRILLEKH